MRNRGDRKVQCVHLRSETTHEISLQDDVARRFRPWKIEAIHLRDQQQIVVLNEKGAEWFDAETMRRIRSEMLFDPKGRVKISTAAVLCDGETILVVAASRPAALGRTQLWLRELK